MIDLYLLRHGEVTSHRGDVPITPAAEEQALAVGRALARQVMGDIQVLSGETRRARDTATHLARGIGESGGVVSGPAVSFALRNPDLYLAGERVNMVSSPEALAEQVDGLSADGVPDLDFFPEFIESPDRIGWWLRHQSPPGDDAATVAARVRAFACSLIDPVADRPDTVVAVTHSPLLRAVGLDFLGRDIGEPPWIAGLRLSIESDRTMSAELYPPEPA